MLLVSKIESRLSNEIEKNYPYITQYFTRTKNTAGQGLVVLLASASAFGLWPIISLARCSASAYCEKCCFGHSLISRHFKRKT